MIPFYNFPFGQSLKKVEQKDRTAKSVFALGVYTSAVHTRWVNNIGKQKVAILAVASEPEIFWMGENAAEIIAQIKIPEELSQLVAPTDKRLNGPSGRALDEFLQPMGYPRKDAWLCDLLPNSREKPQQRKAIDTHYTESIIKQNELTPATIPDFDKSELNQENRRDEILAELEASKVETIILLGDLPIYWFLRFHDKRYTRLAQFGTTQETYGKLHEIKINHKNYQAIPLCHPRQADRLGKSNSTWGILHDGWVNLYNHKLL